jgi:hypothetical protein
MPNRSFTFPFSWSEEGTENIAVEVHATYRPGMPTYLDPEWSPEDVEIRSITLMSENWKGLRKGDRISLDDIPERDRLGRLFVQTKTTS